MLQNDAKFMLKTMHILCHKMIRASDAYKYVKDEKMDFYTFCSLDPAN